MIPIEDMILFVSIANNGSFTQAAKKLNTSVANVSKRVKQLESKLGVLLLIRSTRRLVLTDAGKQLLEHCAPIGIKMEEAYYSIVDSHQKPEGKIILNSNTNFANIVLAPIIEDFLKTYPKINFNIVLVNKLDLPPLGDYHIAFRSGNLKSSNVIAKKFGVIKYVVCTSPKYLEKFGCPLIPEDLSKHNCIDYDYRSEGRIWSFSNKQGEQFHIRTEGNIIANSSAFIRHQVLFGTGIVYLPQFMVKRELAQKKLVKILPQYITKEVPVYIIYPYKTSLLPKKLGVFIDFFLNHVHNLM